MKYEEKIKYNEQNIKVCIRMRPLLSYEDSQFWKIDPCKNIIYTNNYYNEENENIYKSNINKKISFDYSIYTPQKFIFDKIYSIDSKSQIIYKEMCQDAVENVIIGYNSSIFMYGQTTSGKTFTMLGTPYDPGILPCSLHNIFYNINNISQNNKNIFFNVYCTYIEIYNENIHDLLSNSQNLKLIEDKKYGVIVVGAKRVHIRNFEEGIGVKDYGEENRKYRETVFNEFSSRSHCIFQIYIESTLEQEKYNKSKYSCLNLIDLAGSERINDLDSKNNSYFFNNLIFY